MSDNLLKKLKTARLKPESVPRGWRTSREWAENWGLTRNHALLYLNAGLREGIMERREFRVFSGAKCQKLPHYREAAKKTK